MHLGRPPLWRELDETWYLSRYPQAQNEIMDNGLSNAAEHYGTIGKAFGFSPNRFFDEEFYRQAYPAIYAEICRGHIASGFDHYCNQGYLTHDPHWLFSESFYRAGQAEIVTEALASGLYLNGYDHFLECGDRDGLSGHQFLDPVLFSRLVDRHPALSKRPASPFITLIGGNETSLFDLARLSWYFDPIWYLDRYPEIGREIESGRYNSALHHYLTNASPRQFNPQSCFDEDYYARSNGDVLPSIEGGVFRNGYDHFVRFGVRENRSPAEGIDLGLFGRRPDMHALVASGLYDSLYACRVAQHAMHGESIELPPPDESQTRLYFEREATLQKTVLRRQTLDFTLDTAASLSVVLVLHNKFALTMQALASLRDNYTGSIQLILVDSGSDDETAQIEEHVLGAVILRERFNIGYLDGCNAALPHVTASALLYLNNDLRLYPNAIRNALARLEMEPNIAAVGGKLIRSNMWLQEAGSIIWRDGATYGYRRQDSPNIPEVNFTRDVDYCSAAFLLVRSSVVRELGGFDPVFRPAYFEDTDFCLRIIRAGYRIVYDPAVMIEHLEFGSAGTAASQAQIKTNHRLFARQHQDYLRHQQPAHVRNAVLARSHRRSTLRVLFIEDRIPLRGLGAGYVRSNDLVRAMSALGYHVTVFPVLPRPASFIDLAREFPETVELMAESDLGDLAGFIEERAGYYDCVWIGRTHNLTRLLPVLTEQSRLLPVSSVILDTEVVAAPRLIEKTRFYTPDKPLADLSDLLAAELEAAHYCQQIVTVSNADASLVRSAGYANVSVLGHSVPLRPSHTAFADRKDFLFVGALHDQDAPNFDSLSWLINDVLPELDECLPQDISISIAGYVNPALDVSGLVSHPRISWLGPVAELDALYATHRVFIAPTRYAGGLPYKLHEAASFGLPSVATRLLVDQVGWLNGEEIVAASSDDPLGFALAMAELYTNEALWSTVRNGALQAVTRDCDPAGFQKKLAGIVMSSVENSVRLP